jgi:hypothetical protein
MPCCEEDRVDELVPFVKIEVKNVFRAHLPQLAFIKAVALPRPARVVELRDVVAELLPAPAEERHPFLHAVRSAAR